MAKIIMQALREYGEQNGISHEAIFQMVRPGLVVKKVTEEEFVAFLGTIPDLCGRSDVAFSEEQRMAIFQQVDAAKDGAISKADFLKMFSDRYICVKEVAITQACENSPNNGAAGHNLGHLQVDDVVDALEQPNIDQSTGCTRLRVHVLKNQSTGWVTMREPDGVMNLNAYTAYQSFIRDLDVRMLKLHVASQKASAFIHSKSVDLQESKQGPLMEAQSTLSRMRPKVSVLQAKIDQLQKRVDECKLQHSKREEFERRKQEEKQQKQATSNLLNQTSRMRERLRSASDKLQDAAAPFISKSESELGRIEEPITMRSAALAVIEKMKRLIVQAKAIVPDEESKIDATKRAFPDVGREIEQLHSDLQSAEEHVYTTAKLVRNACQGVASAKWSEAAAVLRSTILSRGITTQDLYTELAHMGKGRISESASLTYAENVGGDFHLSPEQRQLLLQRGDAHGMSRGSFLAWVERYYKCRKTIVITSDFDINRSSTSRKLDVDEYVELLEGPKIDEGVGVVRLRGRALSDSTLGWITERGSQGTCFLEEAPKPRMVVTQEVAMQEDFAGEVPCSIRALKPGEVIDVTEGPRKEPAASLLRARGKMRSDGAVGWFTMKNRHGEECIEPNQTIFACLAGVALTDDMDIKNCNLVRKLEVGEVMTLLEGPVDNVASITRIRVRAAKDRAEGWVTMKGSAGKVFAEEIGQFCVVTRAVPLQTNQKSELSTTLRMLAAQELLELLEGPKEEKSTTVVRVRGSALTDGRVGWMTLNKLSLQAWTCTYQCTQATPITENGVATSRALRQLQVGEVIEMLDGPREAGSGMLRLKGLAEKDGIVGWITIIDAKGMNCLACTGLA